MSNSPTDPSGLPLHVPVSSPEDKGNRNWRQLSIGERVAAYDQVWCWAPVPGWRLTAIPGLVNDNRATYRRPRSLWAWVTVLIQLTVRPIKRWGAAR